MLPSLTGRAPDPQRSAERILRLPRGTAIDRPSRGHQSGPGPRRSTVATENPGGSCFQAADLIRGYLRPITSTLNFQRALHTFLVQEVYCLHSRARKLNTSRAFRAAFQPDEDSGFARRLLSACRLASAHRRLGEDPRVVPPSASPDVSQRNCSSLPVGGSISRTWGQP